MLKADFRLKRIGLVLGVLGAMCLAGCPQPTQQDPDQSSDADSGLGAPGSPGHAAAAPAAAVRVGPLEDVSGFIVELRWSAVPGANRYGLFAGADSNPPFVQNLTTTSFTLRDLAPCASYFWRVEATNDAGTTSSETWTFRTKCAAALPQTPAYPAPAHADFGTPIDVSLNWAAAAGATGYDVYFGESISPPFLTSTTGTRVTSLPQLRPGATYYWRVVSKNAEGESSSRVWTFTATASPTGPSTPLCLEPPNRATDTPTTVALDWTDSVGATGYEVYLDTLSQPQRRVAVVTKSEHVATGLELGVTYYWRVVALGASSSTVSSVCSFGTATTPQPPSSPYAPTPLNGGMLISPGTSLAWGGVANSESFEVYLGTDPTPELVATVTSATYSPPGGLADNQLYFWQVIAVNSVGRTDGPIWTFSTGSDADAPPGGNGGGGGDDGFVAGGGSGDGCTRSLRRVAGSGSHAVLSGNGQIVAFANRTALVPGDTNQRTDVFVRNLASGVLTRVSVGSAGEQGAGDSDYPAISHDGRFVAFHSKAAFDSADTNSEYDVYVHDRALSQTRLISRGGSGRSQGPAISRDGRFVAFYSTAATLTGGDANGKADIFVADIVGGTIQLVSVNSGGSQGDADVFGDCSISADGQSIAFSTRASNFAGGGTMGVYVRDRSSSVTTLLSAAGTPAFGASLSYDGRRCALVHTSGGRSQVYVRDRGAAAPVLASAAPSGEAGNATSFVPGMSGDGRYVAFASLASNLSASDSGQWLDVYRRDLSTGAMLLISATASGTGGNANSSTSSSPTMLLSESGRSCVFVTAASDLAGVGQSGVVVAECLP